MTPGNAIPILVKMRQRLARHAMRASDPGARKYARSEVAALDRALAALDRESGRCDLPAAPEEFSDATGGEGQ